MYGLYATPQGGRGMKTLVRWPESQKYMAHPEAKLELNTEKYGPCAYWVPSEVVRQWRQYGRSENYG